MIDLDFLKRLIAAVESSDIDSLEISRWATKIRISKSPAFMLGGGAALPPAHISIRNDAEAPAAAAKTAPAQESAAAAPPKSAEPPAVKLHEVTSPMVGTFYRAPAPDADPYVEIGDRVRVGQTLCILEAMKLMNELETEVGGIIKEIAVENAEPVEYGQVLFRIEPA